MKALVLAALVCAMPAQAGERFDWDRYHDQRDACTEADRIAADCARSGYCDELALRQARRACSPWRN
jgi:hypothetical protein